MGTRGAFGFHLDGKDYIMYNHYDSYPEGLGKSFVRDVKKLMKKPLATIKAQIRKIKLVEDEKPTPEDIKNLEKYTNLAVSEQSTADWYCLTRSLQGELAKVLDAGYMMDSAKFMLDSLFCEYAYILNLDTKIPTVEFYKGFQEKAHTKGRYSKMPIHHDDPELKYFAVALTYKCPANKIPRNWAKLAYPSNSEENQ